jgi:hypothetical protein
MADGSSVCLHEGKKIKNFPCKWEVVLVTSSTDDLNNLAPFSEAAVVFCHLFFAMSSSFPSSSCAEADVGQKSGGCKEFILRARFGLSTIPLVPAAGKLPRNFVS